ncbi:MAG TPA: ABC transporter ATP-binding protein [Spirochaetaceae bacterium]|jgi:ATP-binding cassette subfamily B protein|uniref:ABC-type multidrug/protein/lipid transport system, ATPase component n=1 Tax=uncultured Spirochaetota bacterium TaxID=460511 RepID=A0A652ZY81_9SPIR|nr:ABC-type multidrug/protein/lipid transport system, ATPase component [uncultured Spirochaetota bacterium]HAP56178.1 ABC transporter ATP-binding protein [Spirochaetaceae bacterium]
MLKEYRTILPYLKKYRLFYGLGIFFLVVVDAAQVFIPRLIKRAVDVIAGGGYVMADVLVPALLMVGIMALIAVGRYFWRYFIIGASRRIEAELRNKLFAHFMEMSSDFFQDNKTGDLMARATNDMNAVRQSIGMGFVSFVDGIFMSSLILIAMISDNASVALYTVLPLPLVTVLILFFGKMVGRQFKRVQEVYSKLSDIAQETISGMRVVKAFVKERYFSARFSRTNDSYRDVTMELVKTFGLFFPLISFLAGLSTAILVLAGGGAVIANKMSPGDIIAMIAYLEMLIWPMMGAGFTVNLIQRGSASLKRINEVLDRKSAILEAPDALDIQPSGGLEVRDLEYSYVRDGAKVLQGISFRVGEGETLGILGRVGCGKSTLLKLLPRLLDPGEGKVFFGGRDSGAYTLSALRSVFGFVPQESFLFSASVRDNILFGVDGCSDERFRRLSEIASLDRDLSLFPAGWDTIVGERGLTLSGGQKQRIAIARALALDPGILVLDDALSAVDAETEERILKNLLVERRGRTNILVSHRVSTLRHADRILVLDGGKMLQYGSHGELMKDKKGFYAEIARLQELETEMSSGSQEGGR